MRSSDFGINVVGYLDAVLGQGESARRFCEGLDAAEVRWTGFGLRLPVPATGAPRATRFGTAPFPHRVTVLWCNPDRYGIDLPVDEALTRGRFTAGRWAWELERLPPGWHAAARQLDEIWVSSRFVAGAVEAAVDIPVVVLPLPVAVDPDPQPLDRAALGITEDAFLFCFVFDHHSTMARKNPLGLVDAYRRAFGPEDGTALVIKSVNAASCPEDARALREAAADREDVRIIDVALPPAEKDALLAGCDCYVSLHRSEGLGIAMAETMAHGKPVIATGYSGNLEFMQPGCALLVDHRIRQVGPGAGPYPADGTWAEPDVDHAAALMRTVARDPAGSAALGRRAAVAIAERFAPAVAGAAAARHVARAHGVLAAADAAGAQPQQPSAGRTRSSNGPSSSSSASE